MELARGSSTTADELRAFLRERIANYKIPKLPNGKIDKLALKARALE